MSLMYTSGFNFYDFTLGNNNTQGNIVAGDQGNLKCVQPPSLWIDPNRTSEVMGRQVLIDLKTLTTQTRLLCCFLKCSPPPLTMVN